MRHATLIFDGDFDSLPCRTRFAILPVNIAFTRVSDYFAVRRNAFPPPLAGSVTEHNHLVGFHSYFQLS